MPCYAVVCISHFRMISDERCLCFLHSPYPELSRWMNLVASSNPHFFQVTREFGTSEAGGVLAGTHVIGGGGGLNGGSVIRSGMMRKSSKGVSSRLGDGEEEELFSGRMASHRRAWFAVQASDNRLVLKVCS